MYGDYRRMMQPIRPRAVLNHKGQPGANAETVLFSIEEAELAEFGLKLGELKSDTHGPIEATDTGDHATVNHRIAATLPKWKKVKP